MTSLRTMYLLFLAAFLFLSVVPTVAKVVNSVADCPGFLLQDTPPNLPNKLEGGVIKADRYKPICQTYENKKRFLTLYDVTNKIPVFSAYKYIGAAGTGATPNDWKIEPQLENSPPPREDYMEEEVRSETYTNQARISDYSSGDFDKGHLYPNTHGSTDHARESTYTLTNIVPQAKNFNQKSWKKTEDCVKNVMDNYCKNSNGQIEGFVVTGAEPNTKTPTPEKLGKANVPSIVWSAFCCHYSHKNKNMWIASAHWGDNIKNGPAFLPSQTLIALHNKLGGATNLFPGTQCPLDKKLEDYQGLQINFKACKP